MGCSQSASKPVQRPLDAPAQGPATAAAPQQTTSTAPAAAAASTAATGTTQPAGAAPAANLTAAKLGLAPISTTSVKLQENSGERHRPLIVCGPSGVGKGTLLTRLLKEYPNAFAKSVSHTTRAPRAGEVDGVSYHFTSADALLAAVSEGKFVEHANVHGNYYGTSVASVETVMAAGRLCLLELDIQGVLNVRKIEALQPRCIFVRPPTFDALKTRLSGRGSENDDTMAKRLDTARTEMDFFYTHRNIFDADIINDEFDTAYNNLIAAIQRMYPSIVLQTTTKSAL